MAMEKSKGIWFYNRCPAIALAKMGLVSWEDYVGQWMSVTPDAVSVFDNKWRYLNYLKSNGFSKAALLAAEICWDLEEMEVL